MSGSASVLAVSALAGFGAGYAIPNAYFATYGRPDPWVVGLGFATGLAVEVGLSQLLAPLVAPLGDDALYAGTISGARAGGWERSRWAVLAGGAGLALYGAGAGLEQSRFGSGQLLISIGAATAFVSALTYLGLELTGLVSGYERSRRPREIRSAEE